MKRKTLFIFLGLILVFSLVLGACGPTPTEEVTPEPEEEEEMPAGTYYERAMAGEFEGTVVTMTGPFTDEDAVKFDNSVAEFEEATGIDVQYEGSKEFEASIGIRVEAGDPPDIVDFPQPGLLATFVAQGEVVDVSTFLPEASFDNYIQSWWDMATMEGPDGPIIAGVWHRFFGKSQVWYPQEEFEAAGYEIPTTWDEMVELSDQIVADGDTPWCVGIESGAATGWPATDWMEEVMLRTTSLENYDKWVTGELPFSSDEVKNALTILSDLWADEYVYGGQEAIVTTFFGDAPTPMFEDPPKCWLHKQGNFIVSFFPEGVEGGKDYGFFYLPPIDEEYGKPYLVAGDLMAMFNDRPEVRAVMEFFTKGEALKEWMAAGGGLSPHKDAQLDWYGDNIERGIAALVAEATSVRFDGSDLMPGEVGAGSFWKGMTDYFAGVADMDTVMAEIDASWPSGEMEEMGEFLACQVTDVGGIDDKSFNATAWKGMQDAVDDFGIEAKYLESQQQTDYEVNISAFVDEGCDLIMSVGFLLGDATAAAAEANPDQPFGIVDVDYLAADNLYGSGFAINEATFLAGYLAAGMTETGVVATFGGINIPPVTIFMDGFVLGVDKYNEVHGTEVQVLGWDVAAQDGLFVGNFESSDDGRTMGESLMDEGADIIMPVAGPVGVGTLAVLEERGSGWIIGVDNDWSVQFENNADIVLASALKNMDLYVYETIKAVMDGSFAGGNYLGTLENGGVGLGYGGVEIPEDLKAEVDALIPEIIAGNIATLPAMEAMEEEEEMEEGGLVDLGGAEVTIAVENAYLPFNYIDPDTGEPAGWDYEVWDEICVLLNCVPVYVEAAWEGMIQAVADGQFDAAGDGITITEERDEIVDFSVGYIATEQRLLVRIDEDRIESIEDIVADEDLKLGTQTGTTNYEAATNYLPEERISAFEQFPFAVQALIAGDIDAVIMDDTAGQGYQGENADSVKLVGESISSDFLGFIFPNGSELVEPVNAAIGELAQNGFLDEVNAKYFGPDFSITYDDLFPPEEEEMEEEAMSPEAPESGLGSEGEPIKVLFVPSVDVDFMIESGSLIEDALQAATGHYYEVSVPTSYAATIEEMCASPTDTIGFIPAMGYALANQLCGVEPGLASVRYGWNVYWAEFLVARDSDYETLEDLEGATWAYPDAGSTSGFLFPSAVFDDLDITIGETLEAGGHPQSVKAVYNGEADVATAYFSAPLLPEGSWTVDMPPDIPDELVPDCGLNEEGKLYCGDYRVLDARAAIAEEAPDVVQKVRILDLSAEIPNDTMSFSPDFPEELRQTIMDAIVAYVESEACAETLCNENFYDWTGAAPIFDENFDSVRLLMEAQGISLENIGG